MSEPTMVADGQADVPTMLQEDYKIELVGTVTNPPTVAELLASLRTALEHKHPYQLSPGEVRVLVDHLTEDTP